jgi:hypothetical protein
LDPGSHNGKWYNLGRSSTDRPACDGYDIDPLARLIAQVKAYPIQDERIEAAYEAVLRRTQPDLKMLRTCRVPASVRKRASLTEFHNRDFWFLPQVSEVLALLSYHIAATKMPPSVRDFMWIAFASLILAKKSVANARDIIHSRKHYHPHAKLPDVMAKFETRIKIMCQRMAEYGAFCETAPKSSAVARLGDARRLGLADESIDLVFTSPPYATALDYTRAHFPAVAWMRNAFWRCSRFIPPMTTKRKP